MPRQQRSVVMVEAILDATARILLEDGYDRASTNRVAKRAGVSVGSLYQYFPNKESLVMAVAKRHTDEMLEVLEEHLADFKGMSIEQSVRSYVQAMLAAHAVEPRLHRVLIEQALHLGLEHVDAMQVKAQGLVRRWLHAHATSLRLEDLDTAAFVLVTTVEAVTHAAVLLEPERLETPALEEQVVDLVLRYLLPAAS